METKPHQLKSNITIWDQNLMIKLDNLAVIGKKIEEEEESWINKACSEMKDRKELDKMAMKDKRVNKMKIKICNFIISLILKDLWHQFIEILVMKS